MEILSGGIRLVIWWMLLLIFIYLSVYLFRNFCCSDGESIINVAKKLKIKLLLLITVGVFGYYATNLESAYRWKTKIQAPVKPSSRFEEPVNFNTVTNKLSWEEIQKKNRDENEKARREFEKLLSITENKSI